MHEVDDDVSAIEEDPGFIPIYFMLLTGPYFLLLQKNREFPKQPF